MTISKERLAIGNSIRLTKDGKRNKAYIAWYNMRARCYRPSSRCYSNYGGRGVSVCKRWHDFKSFLDDMGHPPPGTSLDRINNDGNYEPGNCRWATNAEQSRNTGRNIIIEFMGEKKCLSDWAKEINLDKEALRRRFKNGWSVKAALTTPKFYLLEYNGKKKCVSHWAKETGISDKTIAHRLKIGWSIERTLTETPKMGNRS